MDETNALGRKEKGVIIETLPSLKFRVELESNKKVVFCYLGGRLHKNFIRVILGDKVEVFLPKQGDIGRIVKRF